METITYKLEHFEGPLDLLLHLIEKNKVDIYDIPIVEITAQYLEYILTGGLPALHGDPLLLLLHPPLLEGAFLL